MVLKVPIYLFRFADFPFHHRRFIAYGTIAFGLAQLFSGLQHQPDCAGVDECTNTSNIISNFMLCLNGAGFVTFTISLVQKHKEQGKVNNILSKNLVKM